MTEIEEKEPQDIGDYYSLGNAALIIINVVIFVLVDLSHSSLNAEWMLKCGAMYWPYVVENGEYFRLISSMFLHFGVSHIFNNMLVLWFIGGMLEKRIGRIRYLAIYFLTGILAGLTSMCYDILSGQSPLSAGASGAIFGVVGALLYVILRSRKRAEGLTKRQILFFAALTLYSGLASKGVDNAAHIGGFISGFLIAAILCRRMRGSIDKERRDANYDED